MAKSWNQITPLKTTRAEVISLLGEPKPFQGHGPEFFAYEGNKIFIEWARPNCYKIGSVKIDESMATSDSLVYSLKIEFSDASQTRYEEEVKDFLNTIKAPDCIGPHLGACGTSNFEIGFGYSRSARGLNWVHYHATPAETNAWFLTLKPCPVEETTSLKT